MLTLIKLGGSVITDKRGTEQADDVTIAALAAELVAVRAARPALPLVLGHGSGSFGHVYARRFGVHTGIAPDGDWMGFAMTAAAAQRLNRMVVDALLAAGLPAFSIQPSASARSTGGRLGPWAAETVDLALARRMLPVVYGDVAFDTQQGSAICSTEQILASLARRCAGPCRIVLVGESGVFTADPHRDPTARLIRQIDRRSIAAVLAGAGASHGVDVTGGMRGKLEAMWSLVASLPDLTVRLVGPQPGVLREVLLDDRAGHGTTIRQEC
ncbi:MAG: uridylate kinase [Chloroflexi bacterium]|jgi:isopentenyl phosphate kinase|nr:uridylate kinase [Chloroflexota bacterium]